MSVGFAILAYSFQPNLTSLAAAAIRIFGLIIYWFAVLMYQHFYGHSRFLRQYLISMEKLGHTTLDLQSKLFDHPKGKFQQATYLWLIALGILYSLGIALLFLLHI